jgi:exopolysaccharide biosynthesis protein
MNRQNAYGRKPTRPGKPGSVRRGYVYQQGTKASEARKRKVLVLGITMTAAIALLAVVVFALTIVFQGGADKQAVVLATAAVEATPTAAPISTAATPSPAPTSAVTPQPTEDPITWRSKFPGKFTDGEVVQTDNAYKSANIDVTVTMVQENGATYYLADIYLTDLKYFKTAFAHDEFDNGAQSTRAIAKKNNAIVAINGDYCSYNKGPVLRNGVLYRDQNYHDALVLYDDGTMETYTKDEFDMEVARNQDAYQIWTFGPMLLDGGQPMTEFNSSLGKLNPRTAVGYYEPGHYCFIVVDGRQGDYSKGMTFADLSQLFYELGCKAAFNLDGGQTSEMVFMDKFANRPYNGGRAVSDILYIADE